MDSGVEKWYKTGFALFRCPKIRKVIKKIFHFIAAV